MESNSIHINENILSAIKDHSDDEATSIINIINVVDWVDKSGKTLLHHAALSNNSVIAQYLTGKGCNVDAKDHDGDTPLLLSLWACKLATTETLLKSNAKLDSLDTKRGNLFRSLLNYRVDIHRKILLMLLSKIVSDCYDNNDKAQKLLDAHCPFPAVIFLKNVAVTKAMLARGCMIDERLSASRETALHLAVYSLDMENVKLLLDHGANINAQNIAGRTPIAYYELKRNGMDDKFEIFQLLLDRTFIRKDGTLNRASVRQLLYTGDKRIVRKLMSRVDLFQRDHYSDEMVLDQLVRNSNPGVFEILQKLYFDNQVRERDRWVLLLTAVSTRDIRKVRFFLDNGADMNFDIRYNGYKMILDDLLTHPMYTLTLRKVLDLLLHRGLDIQPVLSDKTNEIYKVTCHFDLVKPVLAHLAMIKSFGVHLVDKVYENVGSIVKFKKYFDLCKYQIERMKRMTVFESVMLYDLIRVDKKKVSKYARNQDFVSSYKVSMRKNRSKLCTYYVSTLKFRVEKTISLERSKAKVSLIVCKIGGFPVSMSRTIAYDIVEYLNEKDLKNMLRI